MRKKFTPDEKALIAWAMQSDYNRVHWKDSSNWTKLASIPSGAILKDEFGYQYVKGVNRTATKTCEYGRELRLHSGSIRAVDI